MELIITLLVVCLVLAIAWWALSQLPLPDPIRWVVVVLIAIVAIVFLLNLLPAGAMHLRL